jgi:hypothetical protein
MPFAGRERVNLETSMMSRVEDASVIWRRLPDEQRAGGRDVQSEAATIPGRRLAARASLVAAAAGVASVWDISLTFGPLDDPPPLMRCMNTVNLMRLQEWEKIILYCY